MTRKNTLKTLPNDNDRTGPPINDRRRHENIRYGL